MNAKNEALGMRDSLKDEPWAYEMTSRMSLGYGMTPRMSLRCNEMTSRMSLGYV